MRKVKIEFPTSKTVVYATLLEDKHPDLAADVWNALKEPLKCYVHNTLSTGDFCICRPLPPYHAPAHIGNQSNPLGGKVPFLCELQNGEIMWAGWNFCLTYGPCTEPLVAMGPTMLKVDDQYLDDFHEAGMDLWNHTYLYHTLATVTFSREGE